MLSDERFPKVTVEILLSSGEWRKLGGGGVKLGRGVEDNIEREREGIHNTEIV